LAKVKSSHLLDQIVDRFTLTSPKNPKEDELSQTLKIQRLSLIAQGEIKEALELFNLAIKAINPVTPEDSSPVNQPEIKSP
jgi:hypothetical protein